MNFNFNKYKVDLIFTVTAIIGLLALGMFVSQGQPALKYLILSFGSIVWALRKSDTDGFIVYKRMRRSGDPNPQFHQIESSILFLIVAAQFITACYVVMAS